MGTQQITRQIATFVSRVQKKYKPQQIILYGSYAEGRAKEGSDVDILVVSHAFRNQNEYDRYEELYDVSDDLEPDFHVFGYTPEEVKNPQDAQLKNALSHGILLT
jgi:predicted nucleotidyltransferase